ncbi:aldehyde dehydrogenase family protein, partial [Priestia megaterium]|uniref:aldehyde dehydrogenase family protein n=1 Tax=Priestia megaterium TaxID=1404 RepID=UPI0012B989C4
VLLNPPQLTPISPLNLPHLIQQPPLPKPPLQLFTPHPPQIAQSLLQNQHLNIFTFTPTPTLPQLIRSNPALPKLSLQLPNNSPTLLHKHAHLQKPPSL